LNKEVYVVQYWFHLSNIMESTLEQGYTQILVSYRNIDQTLVSLLHGLLNRWIRLSCYYDRV